MIGIIHNTDALAFFRSMPTESVQTIVTSPPYYGLRDYGVDGQLGLEDTPQAYVAALVEIFHEARRVLRDDGTLWLNLGDSYANDDKWGGATGGKHVRALHGDSIIGPGKRDTGLAPKNLMMIPARVAIALQDDGWILRSDIIWHKPNPMPESVKDRPTSAHEHLFLLAKSGRYYYDADAIAEPSATGFNGSSFTSDYDIETKPGLGMVERVDHDTRNRRNVWTIPTQPYSGAHFAVFPPKLIEPCILAGSKPGDVVCDPFMGSGTTALVAVKHGRKYTGCEINPEYHRLIAERLTVVQVNLFTSAGL